MKTLLLKAQLKKHNRVKDGSVTISFQTMEEVDTDTLLGIDQYWQQEGWLAFKMNEFDGVEMPQENAVVEGGRTPSQELRASLFAKHMHKGGTKETFPAYYNKAMAGFKRAVDDSFEG